MVGRDWRLRLFEVEGPLEIAGVGGVALGGLEGDELPLVEIGEALVKGYHAVLVPAALDEVLEDIGLLGVLDGLLQQFLSV